MIEQQTVEAKFPRDEEIWEVLRKEIHFTTSYGDVYESKYGRGVRAVSGLFRDRLGSPKPRMTEAEVRSVALSLVCQCDSRGREVGTDDLVAFARELGVIGSEG